MGYLVQNWWILGSENLPSSLYGQEDSMANWDQEQSDWLVNNYGFTRCPSEESIHQYHKDSNFIYMINIVDYQLYFSSNISLRKDFEEKAW